ncbi:hypothetical protein RBSWK_05744 [Rhodopirellula baltica SWK14]|uniref:Uncharacterized protein n=1 Tax=Rhodopirellula baltica SWK14 TaxID=993516 RepID=L7C8F4_RHOBT|nr:hypothetical protein RBSWK_05744 [Rhodopirellula baltica SWK14]
MVSIDGTGGTSGQAGLTVIGFESSGYKLATDSQIQFDPDGIGAFSLS